MCDSGVGVERRRDAAERRRVHRRGAVALAPGALKAPASTGVAAVIVTSGSFSAPSASQAAGG